MHVEHYAELYDYFQAYSSGNISFLLIESRGGVGKSYHAEHILQDEPTYFTGHVTPYSLFKTVKDNPKQSLVFDDVDTLLENKRNVALLKQMTDTTEPRRVHWRTTRGGDNVEESFTSHNKTLLLCNVITRSGANIDALKTRAIHIKFTPTNKEVLNQLKQFLNHDKIIQYIDKLEKKPKTLNFRCALKAKELDKAGLDWKMYLKRTLEEAEPDSAQIAHDLHSDESLSSKESIAEYKRITGRSRRSFYNDLKKQ